MRNIQNTKQKKIESICSIALILDIMMMMIIIIIGALSFFVQFHCVVKTVTKERFLFESIHEEFFFFILVYVGN